MEQNTLDALASLTTGLYVLTAGTLEIPSGMIVSWVTQVGAEPPLVMAAVRKNRSLHYLISASGCFGLHVLEKGKPDFDLFFDGMPSEEKFQGLDLFTSVTGAPLIKQTLAWLDCRVVEEFRPGDHTLFLGRVEQAHRVSDEAPMTNHDYGHIYRGQS